MKPLAQYLMEYIDTELERKEGETWDCIDLENWLIEGVEAYESTEGVTLQVVKTDKEMHGAEETKAQKILKLLDDAHCGGSSILVGDPIMGRYDRRVSLKQEPYTEAKDLLAQWNIEELKKDEHKVAPADGKDGKCVDVVASIYEWTCPGCGDLNKAYEYRWAYTCSNCGKNYETRPPEHALER